MSADDSPWARARSPRRALSALVATLLVPPPAIAASAAQAPDELEEIVVTASLRPQSLLEFPASVTVLDAALLEGLGQQHFGDVLGRVPNLNWAGGSSRPRFFQVRGIGELEQYQGAPNPSVAFLVDDVDFSGIGMPASLFDVEQVEVLRGPQGTRYGANALAGLVKIRTRDPVPEPELRTEVTAADHGSFALGAVGGGALGATERAAWRLAAQRFESDGFIHNAFLGRDDTNGRDELTLRGKLRIAAGDAWRLDLAGLYVDLDNGYDAFAVDNSRTTRSDRPGRDAQRSTGGSLRAGGPVGPFTLQSTTSYADSSSVYSFDGDWGNDADWGEYAPYDYFSRYGRERRTLAEDLRLLQGGDAGDAGPGWIAGVYLLRLEEDTLQRDQFAGADLRPPLASEYRATSVAAYGELDRTIGGGVGLSAGLRVENRAAEYTDSDGSRFGPDDTMVGGHLAVSGAWGVATSWYATAARGYKAGGFNIGQLIPAGRRSFAPEYLWNLEGGLRYADPGGRLDVQTALFYMWRSQQQVATSFQVDPGDPLSYVFYTDNAANGRNYGLEASLDWRPLDVLRLAATLGLLGSEYLDYRYGERDLDGREQPHAPNWQYSLAADWQPGGGFGLRVEVNGSDAFYFDASHDQRSQPWSQVGVEARYRAADWSVALWGRNLLDERQAVRGFYFGLEPPDYPARRYVQLGDARQLGVTVDWRLR